MKIDSILQQPHAILSATLVVVLMGVLGYIQMPTNLFPDVNRPNVSVVTKWPGAAATDVAREVTHPVEVRMSAIDGVRRVTSTSRDGVSAVQVEFEYGKPIETAANAITTELSRVRGLLPDGIRDPLVFKITDAARPVMVLAVTPAKGSGLDSGDVRRLAENPLRDALLNLPGVAEAEVFGGEHRQVSVSLDRDRLAAHGLSVGQVAAALSGSNLSRPAGLIHQEGNRYLLTAQTLAKTPEDLAAALVPLPGGDHIRVGDLGEVGWGAADATSLYRGNGKPAVALALLRSEKGYSQHVIDTLQKALPEIKDRFPTLHMEIADTQGRLIGLTVSNMLDSLRDAIVMTIFVILLFLGNTRAAIVVALVLPVSYLITFAVLKAIGYEFNMVTLSAIIIAVGLLVDDAIVVIENIERRMMRLGETGLTAAINGTKEILLADAAGTATTVLVLIPIMFIGGYVQQVLRPLTVTLSIALIASLIASVTLIPLLAPWIVKPGQHDPLGWLLRPFDRFITEPLKRFYLALVTWGLKHRAMIIVGFLLMFAASANQMRFLGREIMPMMDTGVTRITFEVQPDTDDDHMRQYMAQVAKIVEEEVPADWILFTSTVVGSEAAVKAFGAQRRLQQGEMTLNLVDRFHRDEDIWSIQNRIRHRLQQIPGLISANMAVYGATPLSSIRASVDVMIQGADPAVLSRLADEAMARLKNVGGLTGVERSWQGTSLRIELNVNPARARLYGLTAMQVAEQVATQVNGMPGGDLRVPGENAIPIWVRLQADQRDGLVTLAALNIRISDGTLVPLAAMATPRWITEPTAETHQALLPMVDVLAWRRNISITRLHERVEQSLTGLQLPRGYSIHFEGEYKQLQESFQRLVHSFSIGLALLYLMLVVTFRSFLQPLAILFTLPLAIIGAAWGLMIAGKFGSMPGFMGLILLMGVVVNNGILLVDFSRQALKQGKALDEALLAAVAIRTRPILMTAVSAAVGMLPIALEWAVGIERLSPLAIVAIGGLLTGTFLTLLAVPVFAHVLASWKGVK
jgi:multidrug efflux pump subunit AcrB